MSVQTVLHYGHRSRVSWTQYHTGQKARGWACCFLRRLSSTSKKYIDTRRQHFWDGNWTRQIDAIRIKSIRYIRIMRGRHPPSAWKEQNPRSKTPYATKLSKRITRKFRIDSFHVNGVNSQNASFPVAKSLPRKSTTATMAVWKAINKGTITVFVKLCHLLKISYRSFPGSADWLSRKITSYANTICNYFF